MHPEATVIPPHGTIGVFDSGFGGLTVLRALLPRLPGTHFLYLGDTARLPYGAKSQATVARYAVESAHFLVAKGARLLVIACNTATALALPEIRAAVPVPVIGVVEPGAQAALAAASSQSTSQTVISTEAKRSGETRVFKARAEGTSLPSATQPNILVLATAATVASHAYRDTCASLGLHAAEMPCPLLVPLVEEGWTDHPVTRDVLRIYLTEALAATTPDAVVLGCTHYPLIAPAITQTLRDLGCHAPVVDSAEATAHATQLALNPGALQRAGALPLPAFSMQGIASAETPATFTCYATDSIDKFARLGSHFLGQPIPHVHLLDLGG
ncbi:MAG TPA: aspartate/glutamate racemase family protein [Acidobacteriaceae bacterium]|nr:aspartate/glutamate racemase family protein [Acidobacteriaceae bacterium]